MPHAHAEERKVGPQLAHGLQADAAVGGRPGAGRDEHAAGRQRADLGDGELVVLDDVEVDAEIAEVLLSLGVVGFGGGRAAAASSEEEGEKAGGERERGAGARDGGGGASVACSLDRSSFLASPALSLTWHRLYVKLS